MIGVSRLTTQPPIPIVKWGPSRAIVQGLAEARIEINLASLSTLTRSGVEFRQR
ncbi:hypothetical protein BDV18DRAFT_147498 [Aspergillus unguis]